MRTLVAVALSLVALDLSASGREIAPRPLVPAAYNIGRVSTAFAADRFLTVWPFGTSIVGVLSDAEGNRISDAWFPLVHDEAGAHTIELVGTGDSWALFWRNGLAPRYRMAHIDADGEVTRIVDVAFSSLLATPISWNGTHFVGVTQLADAVVFDRDGRIVRQGKLESADYRTITAAGGGFVAMATISGITAQRIDAGSGVSPRIDVERVFTVPRPHALVTTQNGAGDVLAVWALGTDGIKSAILRRNGSVTEAMHLSIAERQNIHPLHVAALEDGFRLFFTTGTTSRTPHTLRTVLLDRSGAAAGPSEVVATLATFNSPPLSIASGDAATLFAVPSQFNPVTPVRTIAVRHGGGAPHEEIVSIAPARQRDPKIVAVNGRYVATWTQSSIFEASAHAAILTPNAEPIANVVVAENVAPLDLASNGNEILVVGTHDRRLTGTRMTAGGIRVDREPLFIADDVSDAAVVWAGDRWVVAWNTNTQVFTAEVALDGTVSAPRELRAAVDRLTSGVLLAFDGRDVLVVWHGQSPGACIPPIFPCPSERDELLTARRDDAMATLIARGREADAIASSGREFAVLRGGEVFFVRIAGGAIVAEAPRTLFAYPRDIRGDITWDGIEYVVALRYGIYRAHLSVQRITPGGFATSPARYAEVLPAEFTRVAAPGVAAERGRGAVIVMHENAPGDPARVVAHLEDEMQPRMAPPPAPAGARFHGNLLEWDPVPGAEGYVIENGSGELLQNVPAGTHSTQVFDLRTNPRVRAFNGGGLSPATSARPTKRHRSTR